jgi:uracil-DNA glycosylase
MIASLVDALTRLPALPDTFNPYRDTCAVYDMPDAAEIRRENLTVLLRRAVELPEIDMWVGREPGYLGARRTGVALMDEARLPEYARAMGVTLRRATRKDARPERTARAVGIALQEIASPIFFWNVCPLHTHEPDNPFSNAKHTAEAAAASRSILEEIIAFVRPRRIIALGDTADAALLKAGMHANLVSHPTAWTAKQRPLFLPAIREMYSPKPRHWDRT